MSAGTLTLTNNSAQVSGAGTSFTTELTAGDFIVVTVGGIPYTLPVKSVESGTALTLISNFTGPTQSGAAWSAVPRVALNMVTAALVAQSAEALRGLNYDKQNWQQFFTATGDVTITLPDNSQTTGPSAKKLISSVDDKADKTDLDKKADSYFPNFTGKMHFDGDNGGTIYHSAGSLIFGAGGEERAQLSGSGLFLNGEMDSQACYRSRKGVGGAISTNRWCFYWDSGLYAWVDNVNVGQVSLVTTSDKMLKKEIEYLLDRNEIDGISTSARALSEVMGWKPATFKFKERGIIPESETKLGFIANDLRALSPDCVKGKGLKEGYDENDVSDAYSLDETAMIAKLTLSIQELQKQIAELQGSRV
ncbi:TPA: tail fiber domain-containing protein [Citrobacter braakii]|nr:tail fiber domain-containing protein [Citrobacter braakii]